MLVVNGVKRWIMSENVSASLAIVDPELTVTCPPRVTAFTGMDALAHAVEGYMSLDGSSLVDALALEVSHLVGRYLPKAYYNGMDIEARYYMSFAATMAGLILCSTGAVYAHSISYTLVRYGVPHGMGTGFGLPYAMDINLPVITEKLARLGEAFGMKEGSLRDKAAFSVSFVHQLIKDVGMPRSLKEMNVPREDLDMLAKELVEKYQRYNNPRRLSYEDALRLYEVMWDGQD
jgi:alcohol dehydrogenase